MQPSIKKGESLLGLKRKQKKNKQEILAQLKTIWLAKEVAVVHCKWHQKGDALGYQGNRAVDLVT